MTSDATTYTSPQGELTLERFPRPAANGREQTLQAWDTADTLLLKSLEDQPVEQSLALLNDNFGALTCSSLQLGFTTLTRWSDSFLADTACRQNLAKNQLSLDPICWSDGISITPQIYDLVLIRIPKTLALLEDQLYRLRPHINAQTRVIAGAMVKHLPPGARQLFEHIIGPTDLSLTEKKARLIFCQPTPENWQGESPYPTELVVSLNEQELSLSNHANVFCRDQLDIGSRFLLEHLPTIKAGADVVDLGCGNGILGLAIALNQPQVKLTFTDESYMAIASAKRNLERHAATVSSQFYTCHSLQPLAPNSANVVINNPPFHQQHVVGDHIAWAMFKDAKRVLRSGGELWVVSNRHLNYQQKLQKLFGNCTNVASNAKFVVLKAYS